MARIDPARLRDLLTDVAFVTRVVVLEETSSTNDDAQRLAQEGAPEGTVVMAERQSAGRGRLARSWHSPAGLGLYVSVLLRPTEPLERWTRWTIASAVAACEACREISLLDVVIKWPNDLLVHGRKVGGILAELRSTGGAASALVVGAGINVHHAESDFPPDLEGRATSLRMAGGAAEVDRTLLAAAYLRGLDRVRETIARGDWSAIAAAFERRSPGASGRRVRVVPGAGPMLVPFEGLTRGLDTTGALRIERATGELVSLRPGESVAALEG